MEPSCPLGTTRCIPQAKFHQKPYNKSFIDQVCSVKMAGYWPRSFFASLWTSTSCRSINTQKKELGQYPAILTSHLVNNPYLLHLDPREKISSPIQDLFCSRKSLTYLGSASVQCGLHGRTDYPLSKALTFFTQTSVSYWTPLLSRK